jgi:hypothetical protein
MSRTLLVLNAIIAALACVIICNLMRWTGRVPWVQLAWFAPPVATWFALRSSRRAVGGLAAIANVLLVLAGVVMSAMSSFAGSDPPGSFDPRALLAGVFLVAVGVLNFREVWAAFPRERKAGSPLGE